MAHKGPSEVERLLESVGELSDERRALLLHRLAARRRARSSADDPIHRRSPGTDRLPCSPGQERLYYQHQLDPLSVSYLVPVRLRMRGAVDPAALARALDGLVSRHEVLRTGFETDTEQVPVQVVHQAVSVPMTEGTGTASDVDAQVLSLTRTPFELASPPLLRAGLWRLTDRPEEWVFALCVHHIVVDGWSLGVLVDELAALYGANLAGASSDLPDLPIQYGDYVLWQRARLTRAAAGELDFWRSALDGAPPLELPGDRARPTRPTFDGAAVPVRIVPHVAAALDRLGREAGATPFMVLLAAFTVLLRRWSGQSDLVVGTPVAGRSRPELEGLVGFFVNTLILRLDLTGTGSFRALLDRVRTAALDGLAHQETPFEHIVREVGVARQGGRPVLPRVLFGLRNVPLDVPRLDGLDVTVDELPRVGTDLDLSLELAPDSGGGFSGWLVYAADLFDEDTARRMADGFDALVAAIADDPRRPLADLPVLPAAEHRRLATENSAAAVSATTVSAMVRAQAMRTPNAVAVLTDTPLTYRELDRRANHLAAALVAAGVRVEDRVGVCVHRGADLLVAVLGVLRSGAVYLPLDPDQPRGRLELIAKDADPCLLVTSADLAGGLGPEIATVIVGAGTAAEPPSVTVDPTNAACLLYTSGSTGRPKGVLLTQQGVANRMAWMATEYRFGASDVVLQRTPIGSDPSLWEMLVPLCSGGRIVFAGPGRHGDVEHVIELLGDHQVTACDFVPAMLVGALADERFAESAGALRLVVCGGEELPARAADSLLDLLPHAELHNFYGPTEVSFDATAARVTRPVPTQIPIGRPVTGVSAFVLDQDFAVQPVGVPGELFLGGPQLARGYLGRPGHTAEVMVPHPFRPGERLYRTGDRVRWRADGGLDFLGRLDSQIKIRGYRVEPGEIEAVLLAEDAVGQAVVRAFPTASGPRLVGFLTPAHDDVALRVDDVRRRLATRLPRPMIPSAFVVLDELPLLPNGKVDREALREPEHRTVAPLPPSTPLEDVLCHVWAQVLDVGDIGVHDDFFELGGHSLVATRVVSQVRELFRVDFPLHFFVETPTVAEFAVLLREHGAVAGVDVDQVAELVLRVRAMSAEEVDAQLGSA